MNNFPDICETSISGLTKAPLAAQFHMRLRPGTYKSGAVTLALHADRTYPELSEPSRQGITMTLHCPHCHAEHDLKQPGEQVCASCGKAFTVDEIPVYESGAEIAPQILPDGAEVTVQDTPQEILTWKDLWLFNAKLVAALLFGQAAYLMLVL